MTLYLRCTCARYERPAGCVCCEVAWSPRRLSDVRLWKPHNEREMPQSVVCDSINQIRHAGPPYWICRKRPRKLHKLINRLVSSLTAGIRPPIYHHFACSPSRLLRGPSLFLYSLWSCQFANIFFQETLNDLLWIHGVKNIQMNLCIGIPCRTSRKNQNVLCYNLWAITSLDSYY